MRSLLLFCLLGTSVPALTMTPAEPLITRSSITELQLCITLANLEQQKTFVRVRSLVDGDVYFADTVRKHNGYQANLNLQDLPAGRYVVEVQKGDTLRRQVMLKTDTQLLCSGWR